MDRRQALPLVISAVILLALAGFTLAHRSAGPLTDPEARAGDGPREAVDIYATSGEDQRITRPQSPPRRTPPSDGVHGTSNTEPGRGPPVEYDAPPTWRRRASRGGMRWAEFELPGARPADLVVFWFGPGGGGGVEANLERWKGQVESPTPAESRTLDAGPGITVTTVLAEGTIRSAMGSSPNAPVGEPGMALYGAIIECPEGPLFVKATGAQETIRDHEDAIVSFLQSFRVRE